MQRKRRLQQDRHAGDASGTNEKLGASDAGGASDAAAVAAQARHAQGCLRWWWRGERATRAHTRTFTHVHVRKRTLAKPHTRMQHAPMKACAQAQIHETTYAYEHWRCTQLRSLTYLTQSEALRETRDSYPVQPPSGLLPQFRARWLQARTPPRSG